MLSTLGATIARNVRFEFEPALTSTHADPWPSEKSSLLVGGIPTLPPSKRFQFFFDSFPSRVEKLLPLTYEVSVIYESHDGQRSFQERHTLDLAFLLGTTEIRRKKLHDVGESLDKLAKEVHLWTENLNGIRVYTVDRERYEREVAIAFAFRKVRSSKEGKTKEQIGVELAEALAGIGERVVPPDTWVNSIVNDEDIWFRLEELEEMAVQPPRNAAS